MMSKVQQYLPWVVFFIALLYAGQKIMVPDQIKSEFNLNTFREIPVSAGGRTKPLDTVARNSLKNMSGRQSLKIEEEIETEEGPKKVVRQVSAIEWYIELITDPDESVTRRVFRIDHPDVLAMLGLQDEKRTRFSFEEIIEEGALINEQAGKAFAVKAKARDPFQNAILVLNQRLMLYSRLSQMQEPYLVPPLRIGEDWRSFVDVLTENPSDPDALSMLRMLQNYRIDDSQRFNMALVEFDQLIETQIPSEARKARYEVVYNQAQPFYTASILYVFAFLLGCFGLLMSQSPKSGLSKALFANMTSLILVAFIVQTIGITSRIYLQGRPPVTNLYSSAVFIGWFTAILGLIIDRQMKLGLGGIMASAIGFGTLIVAHNLGSSGDTMEMMQAVLDTNFWLATHVVVVTIGYSATFFAGFLATAYVLLGVFTKTLDHERGKSLSKMIYGVICFATLMSFVGTVLGGIWADQSWGRFWGWDAKENGAALIVLMNLLILHARWGGMVRDRGVAVLAIGGNIITAWSWFGTNMLGVGLHSYGFTNSAVFWIMVFMLIQIGLMIIGLIPMQVWRSKFARAAKTPGGKPSASPAG
jgi:ABC-type transport system involved in cytochrome c biogenesis permease subunit